MNGEMKKLGFWGAILRPKNDFLAIFFPFNVEMDKKLPNDCLTPHAVG